MYITAMYCKCIKMHLNAITFNKMYLNVQYSICVCRCINLTNARNVQGMQQAAAALPHKPQICKNVVKCTRMQCQAYMCTICK